MINQIIGRTVTLSKALTKMQMDCIDLLRTDHMKVELMLIRLRLMKDPQSRRILYGRIQTMILQHMKLEEDIFYPASSHVQGLQGEVEHSYHEHQEIRSMMDDLSDMNPRSPKFNTILTQMILKLEHHIIGEENKMFPAVMRRMNRAQFQRLNRHVKQRHEGQEEEAQVSKAA